MTTTTDNALARFVAKTRELFAREADPEARFAALAPIFEELLTDRRVIEASKSWPLCVFADGRAENLLFYEDPDHGFVVNALVTAAAGYENGLRGRIHDHGDIYTLYGILDGRQIIERYERTDDGSKADRAELRETASSESGPGEIDLVRPFEIHNEASLGERAVAVIVRSSRNDVVTGGRYELGTNRYFEGFGPRQTRMEMFPV